MKNYNKLPLKLDSLIHTTIDNIISKKWGEPLYPSDILFDYEDEANQRTLWYSSLADGVDGTYDMWLDYKAEIGGMSGGSESFISLSLNNALEVTNDSESVVVLTEDTDTSDVVIPEEQTEKEQNEEEQEWNF